MRMKEASRAISPFRCIDRLNPRLVTYLIVDPMSTFKFQARWKEELVCTGPGGSFVLELPMGVLSAYLPTEEEWRRRAPAWARHHWRELHDELQEWCKKVGAKFIVDETAQIY
jgi:hypothetical protein